MRVVYFRFLHARSISQAVKHRTRLLTRLAVIPAGENLKCTRLYSCSYMIVPLIYIVCSVRLYQELFPFYSKRHFIHL